MRVISSEEFLKQPKKVRDTILEWWKPSVYDLIHIENIGEEYETFETFISKEDADHYGLDFFNSITGGIDGEVIPLLTEVQLREFIKDISGRAIDLVFYGEGNIEIDLIGEKYEIYKTYGNLGKDLLQALWKVACDIILKEE